jgi:hypothetical protein
LLRQFLSSILASFLNLWSFIESDHSVLTFAHTISIEQDVFREAPLFAIHAVSYHSFFHHASKIFNKLLDGQQLFTDTGTALTSVLLDCKRADTRYRPLASSTVATTPASEGVVES